MGTRNLGPQHRFEDDARTMTSQPSSPSRLAKLIEDGGVLSGFPWPDRVCETGMRIGRDGTWYHNGDAITRIRLCQLFSTALHRDEAGDFWLVTPAEKGLIAVEDAPFLAVEMEVDGVGEEQILRFRTSLDHWVTAGPDHPIRVEIDAETGEPSPYVLFRSGLEARLNRPVFYALADLVEERMVGGSCRLGVVSNGSFFDVGEAE